MSFLNAKRDNGMSDGFTRIKRCPANIDRWIIRSSIFEQLERSLPMFHGRLLDVGCGRMPYRNTILQRSAVSEYVGLDLARALSCGGDIRPDVTWDGYTMPFSDESFDTAIATEVFEHASDTGRLLAEVNRVLRPSGVLFFTTPFVWPYHEVPYDMQRWTTFGLSHQLKESGFTEISITSVGNWHSSFAQFIGLWVARSSMPSLLRRALRPPLFLTQLLLMRYESLDGNEEGCMPRMLAGVVEKGSNSAPNTGPKRSDCAR